MYRHDLSPREIQVKDYVCKGMTNKQIATVLCITVKTVKYHMTNIMRKYDVKNRQQVIVKEFDLG